MKLTHNTLYILRLLLLLTGFGLAIGLILYEGVGEIYQALTVAGWGIILIAGCHLVPMAAETLGWQRLFNPAARPGYTLLYWSRWVGEAVDGFLPVAQIGGDLVRVRLLDLFKFSKIQTAATLVVDITLTLAAQIIFTLAGIILLAGLYAQDILINATVVLICTAIPVIALFYLFQKQGMFGMFARWIKIIAGKFELTQLVDNADIIDQAVIDIYKRPYDITISTAWLLLAWILGTLEIWLALWLLGYPSSLVTAIIIESLVQAARSFAFIVPAAIGVQESAFMGLGIAVGLPADISLALGMTRRFRELMLGIPALLTWKYTELNSMLDSPASGRLLHRFRLNIPHLDNAGPEYEDVIATHCKNEERFSE